MICTEPNNMFLNVRIHSIITFFFYLILIGVSIQSWNNLMEESSTFDEAFIETEVRFPSFTLCPSANFYSNKSIESFEDVSEEIKNLKMNFKIDYFEFKPYEDVKIVEETYNQTLNNDWFFAPKISEIHPFETIICLIMAPYREHKYNPDRTYSVSYWNCEIVLNYINYILVLNTSIVDCCLNRIFWIIIL